MSWNVSLDASNPAEQPPTQSPGPTPPRSTRLARVGLGVVLLLIAVTWIPALFRDAPAPKVAVVGTRLGAPVTMTLPSDATTTADDSYVGFQVPGGAVMVTIPSQVVSPNGQRATIPADPVGWLKDHPSVLVSRVRTVTVGGEQVQQVDYRRSRLARPQSQFAALNLFCGWSDSQTNSTRLALSPQACTRITSNARVRATFIPVGNRMVMVEMVWRPTEDTPAWPIPQDLRRTYTTLLSSLAIRPA